MYISSIAVNSFILTMILMIRKKSETPITGYQYLTCVSSCIIQVIWQAIKMYCSSFGWITSRQSNASVSVGFLLISNITALLSVWDITFSTSSANKRNFQISVKSTNRYSEELQYRYVRFNSISKCRTYMLIHESWH